MELTQCIVSVNVLGYVVAPVRNITMQVLWSLAMFQVLTSLAMPLNHPDNALLPDHAVPVYLAIDGIMPQY